MSIDILNLRAQRQILRYSVDYLQDKIALLAAERRTREREMKQDERMRRGWRGTKVCLALKQRVRRNLCIKEQVKRRFIL